MEKKDPEIRENRIPDEVEPRCKLLGSARSCSPAEVRLLQLHLPRPSSSKAKHAFPRARTRTHTHTVCYIHIHTTGHAHQHRQTHWVLRSWHRWPHPVPLAGWSGWKYLSGKYIQCGCPQIQTPVLPGIQNPSLPMCWHPDKAAPRHLQWVPGTQTLPAHADSPGSSAPRKIARNGV